MNQIGTPLPALSPQGGERVAEGRERGRFMEAPFRFSACTGTMNQIGTPLPALSPQGGERVAEGRERGGSWRAPFRFSACTGTMNQIGTPLPALSPQGGERVAEGRERGGSWRANTSNCGRASEPWRATLTTYGTRLACRFGRHPCRPSALRARMPAEPAARRAALRSHRSSIEISGRDSVY